MPELALGGKLPPVEGDPFGDWAELPSDVAASFNKSKQVQEAPAPPRAQRERGKKHFWYGMSREEIKDLESPEEAKANGRGKKQKAPAEGQGEKSSFMRALEKREKARGRSVRAGDGARGRRKEDPREAKSSQSTAPAKPGGKKPPQAPPGNIGLKRRILRG
eukprot:s2727_g3.t1